jgi:hypothetical protein
VERMKDPTPIRLLIEICKLGFSGNITLIRGCPQPFLSDSDTITLLLSGYSFVRWGDGETAIVRGKDIYYQQADEKLSCKLKRLAFHPPSRTIIGLPWTVEKSLFSTKWNIRIFKIMFSTRVFWSSLFDLRKNQLLLGRTEFWWNHASKITEILTQISLRASATVLIGPKRFLKFCPKKTHHIEIPERDAFSDYQSICLQIEKIIRSSSGLVAILVAAGPTAKAIAADFAEKSQVIDVGHGFNFAEGGFGSWSWSTRNNRQNE